MTASASGKASLRARVLAPTPQQRSKTRASLHLTFFRRCRATWDGETQSETRTSLVSILTVY
jgi:hypothetical protein